MIQRFGPPSGIPVLGTVFVGTVFVGARLSSAPTFAALGLAEWQTDVLIHTDGAATQRPSKSTKIEEEALTLTTRPQVDPDGQAPGYRQASQAVFLVVWRHLHRRRRDPRQRLTPPGALPASEHYLWPAC